MSVLGSIPWSGLPWGLAAMGSVGAAHVCCLCRRWSPSDSCELYDDAIDYVPIACGKCRKRFRDSGLSCWQDLFLLQPLQMLGFCNKLPMRDCREA